MTSSESRYDLDREALGALMADAGQPSYRVDQIWDGLYRRLADPSELTELPNALREALRAHPAMSPALALERESTADGGDTVKWLWSLTDGARVETVLMHYPGRSTVCVSSQAGCAMGCGFCATGQAGFTRHLHRGEMVEQVVRAAQHAARTGRRVSRVVFMGMGEPLANYDQTLAAVRRLHTDMGLSARHLTLSTVGIVPGIQRLTAEPLPLNLSVSLHAANDRLRDALVPINRRYPLAELTAACAAYVAAKGRRLSFEWACIDRVNDRPADAVELSRLATPLRAHVNLIPLNPTPGYGTRGTPPAGVRALRERLASLGVNATVRQTRGTDIDAACGQLAATDRGPVSVRSAASAP
jgi:23S rRNA (adenine2503-C2)-methyltransferase